MIVILKVLSRILPKLSVARTANVVVIGSVTNVGVPLIIPVVEFNVKLVGNVPANIVYVTLTAGLTGLADNAYVMLIPYG